VALVETASGFLFKAELSPFLNLSSLPTLEETAPLLVATERACEALAVKAPSFSPKALDFSNNFFQREKYNYPG
jgi:hypothetical protein